MSTVLAIYDSTGACLGRCDAKCHDAHEDACDCICAGANHGGGRMKAIVNTRQHAHGWLTMFAAKHQLDRSTLEEMVGVDVVQDVLFDPDEEPDDEGEIE